MKIQDILFIIILLGLLYKRSPVLVAWVVFGAVLIAIPLFQLQIFFTAQRLMYYAFALMLVATLLFLFKKR